MRADRGRRLARLLGEGPLSRRGGSLRTWSRLTVGTTVCLTSFGPSRLARVACFGLSPRGAAASSDTAPGYTKTKTGEARGRMRRISDRARDQLRQ